ncbi:hemin ABC transporter substrate-binding protein [Alteromonas marina]|uniref:heme/hemin ABC transporter substrate-binding protein n=1 Tax=Alteromonas sp. KUL150 TaxID=2480805 RepID=UPI0012E601E4|nr:ABC transporter substrate-binding protein [Alteromonas sp. KUL150]GFD87101.1 hemin-binding protein [Alteromonas sp. KUL150]
MRKQQLLFYTFIGLVFTFSTHASANAIKSETPNTQELSSEETAHYQKLITAGGTITEIVFALGAGERVIAVDQSSQYPEAVKQLPMVGYYRELAAEGVLSFAPDKILAIEGVGREEVIKQIESTGVQVVVYNKPNSTDGLVELIKQLADDLGKAEQAKQIIAKFNASLPSETANNTPSVKAVFLLSASDRGLIAAGSETVPQLIFNYAGIENIASEHTGFKGINNEALALHQPDFLVAPRHVVMGAGGKEKFCQSPNLSLLKAAQQCKLLVMDSLQSLGMTPRLADAIATVKNYQLENL